MTLRSVDLINKTKLFTYSNMNTFNARIGTNLREARERAGYTQDEVAAELGVKQGAVAHWEKGRRNISLSRLHRLAEMYGTTVEALVSTGETKTVPSLEKRLSQLEKKVQAIEEDPKERSNASLTRGRDIAYRQIPLGPITRNKAGMEYWFFTLPLCLNAD